MNQYKNLPRLYKCESCGNEISGITKLEQSNPSSKIWARYGLCSAGCMAHTPTLRVEEIRENLKSVESANYIADRKQIRGFDSQVTNEKSITGTSSGFRKNKILTWQRCITRGKLLAGIGLTAGIILYYNEIVYGAMAFLILVVIGIVLCRIGVWKKCRVK